MLPSQLCPPHRCSTRRGLKRGLGGDSAGSWAGVHLFLILGPRATPRSSAWQQSWKRKLFKMPHRAQGEKPSLHHHPYCNTWNQHVPIFLVPKKASLISYLCSIFDILVKNKPLHSPSTFFLLDLWIAPPTHTHTHSTPTSGLCSHCAPGTSFFSYAYV